MKPFDQMIGEQAGRVRQDVEALRGRMIKVAGAIERNCSDDVRIYHRLRQISRDQSSFNDRVDDIRSRLQKTKSLLAFRKS